MLRTVMHVLVLVTLLSTTLEAHGGQYFGPADAGGSGPVGGGGGNAPTDASGDAGAGPSNPYGSAGVGKTSSGYVRGGKLGARDQYNSTTGGYQPEANYEIWEFWWENNKDRFLALKQRLSKTTSVTGGFSHLTGHGRQSDTIRTRRPSAQQILTEVLPVLRELASSSDDRDIIDSAVLAMGRVALEGDAAEVIRVSTSLLRHAELSVQAAATLSLGALASPQATPLLCELLSDSSRGRQLLGGGQVPWLVRSFAALSLGLIGDAPAVHTLVQVVEKLKDSNKNIKVCAIVGLSLLIDEELKATAARALERQLAVRNMDIFIKSYIPTTLGKLEQPSSLQPVLNAFLDRDTNNLVRQSSAIGLGRLATVEDERAVEALVDYVAEGRDVQTRHFALISLAKVGARDALPLAHVEAHKVIAGTLLGEVAKPSSRGHRSWAALASALYGRAHKAKRLDIIERLTVSYEDERDPSFKAAFAVALGLLNAKSAAGLIHEDFLDSKDDDFRGYAAVSLGFLKHGPAANAMRRHIQDKSTTPTFRLQAATGLGLMADARAVDVLVEGLQGAQTLGVSSALAKALGLIGDRDALEPLVALVSDESKTELTRAFAAVALGLVGEKTELPWNAGIREDNNYRARVPAMTEVLDIL